MRLIVLLIISFFLSSPLYAGNNPFEKKVIVNIDSATAWKVSEGVATKTGKDKKGQFYHLMFDKKQLRLSVTRDEQGKSQKSFSRYEIIDVQVNGDRLALFDWCLDNQSSHNHFLQQGESVRNNVCVVDGEQGEFTLWLDAPSLRAIENGRQLTFIIKPYRTPVKITYELNDFRPMLAALDTKPAPKAAVPVAVATTSSSVRMKKCRVSAPAKYKKVRSVEYNCNDVAGKKAAEATLAKRIDAERARIQAREAKQAKERERKLKAEQERQQKELEANRRLQEEQRKLAAQQTLEAEAVAASAARQSELGTEITIKMVSMCQKYWTKGEHRCYCQKFIEYAPAEIQASSTCPAE